MLLNTLKNKKLKKTLEARFYCFFFGEFYWAGFLMPTLLYCQPICIRKKNLRFVASATGIAALAEAALCIMLMTSC